MRLVKHIAQRTPFSRRYVDRQLQTEGAWVNGKQIFDPAHDVSGDDSIVFQGKKLSLDLPRARLFRYHKPKGLLTSHADPKGRPCLFDHLPPHLPKGLISIGRLDMATEGLLLLTNCGTLKRTMELPQTGLVRTYHVTFRGPPLKATHQKQAHKGLTIDGMRYAPCTLTLFPGEACCTLALTEGKNREVRRIMAFWGCHVTRLIRLSYGPFHLNTLARGQVDEVPAAHFKKLSKKDI